MLVFSISSVCEEVVAPPPSPVSTVALCGSEGELSVCEDVCGKLLSDSFPTLPVVLMLYFLWFIISFF